MERFAIGTIARLAGVRASAIRYYESVGVLEPPPRQGGQRRYSRDVLIRLAVIRKGRDLGFSISELRQLFREFPDDITASERWHRLAERKLTQLDEQISRSERIRSELKNTLDCGCVTFASCSLISGQVPSATAM